MSCNLNKITVLLAFFLAAALSHGCKQNNSAPSLSPDDSKLSKATDVFWALQNMGFMVVKEKPVPTKHGCKPFEYLVQKGPTKAIVSRFRVSVFQCPSKEKAEKIVENEHTRMVDSLLRNHHEGGVLRRQATEIIIRKEKGSDESSDDLLKAIGGM